MILEAETAQPLVVNQNVLAKHLRISPSTVSRALSGNGRVGAELRDRIVQEAQRMGCRRPARRLRAAGRRPRSSGLICVEIDHNDSWQELLIGGAIEAAKEMGHEVITAPHRLGAFPRVVLDGHADGLVRLLSDGDFRSGAHMEDSLVPTVTILFPYPGADLVSVDAFESACALGVHLGDKRPGLTACVSLSTYIGRERLFGLMSGLWERGATLPMELVRTTADITAKFAMPRVEELLDLRAAGRPEHQFTLMAFYNDYMARCAINRIRARGLRVPEDIGVAGYDDMVADSLDTALSSDLRLTTVHLPIRELGREAVRRLNARLQHPGEPPLCRLLDTQVIEGSSVRQR